MFYRWVNRMTEASPSPSQIRVRVKWPSQWFFNKYKNGVWTKRGLGHGLPCGLGHGLPYGLSYGLPVVDF